MYTRFGAVEHLERDHRRTYAEACVLIDSLEEGTLGCKTLNSKQKFSNVISSPQGCTIRRNSYRL
jgi:hypothetical protein